MWHLTLHRWSGDPAEAVKTTLEDHLHWMHDQQLTGRILIAGPTPDRSVGIMVFGHMTEVEVHEICRSDPFVAGGFRSYEVIPWDVHHLLGIGAFEPAEVVRRAATRQEADRQSD